jgi:hypothetical protein
MAVSPPKSEQFPAQANTASKTAVASDNWLDVGHEARLGRALAERALQSNERPPAADGGGATSFRARVDGRLI